MPARNHELDLLCLFRGDHLQGGLPFPRASEDQETCEPKS
jgi:hypothetical protein